MALLLCTANGLSASSSSVTSKRSVPPCETRTVPSDYRCTSAPPRFMKLAVKAMPNLEGTSAAPRFFHLFKVLKAAARWRPGMSNSRYSLSNILGTFHFPVNSPPNLMPKGVESSNVYEMSLLNLSPETPHATAR